MRTVTLRQLRDTRQIKEWLAAGVRIEVRDRNQVIGELVPRSEPERTVEWPDFKARRRAIFDNRVIPAVQILLEERESSRF